MVEEYRGLASRLHIKRGRPAISDQDEKIRYRISLTSELTRRPLSQTRGLLALGSQLRRHAVLASFDVVQKDLAQIAAGNSQIGASAEAILVSMKDVALSARQVASVAEEAASASAQAAAAAKQQARGAEDLAAAIEEIASLAETIQHSNG